MLTAVILTFRVYAYVHSDRWSSVQSNELKSWLHAHGVATNRTISYNPQGNGQYKRYNGIICKTVQAALKPRRLPVTHWQEVLLDALHSIRSLLCTAINCTPFERMFLHARRFVSGQTIPSWLKPGPMDAKKRVHNKLHPMVDEAELLQVNPNYAHVRMQDGRETSLSVTDISPRTRAEGSENDAKNKVRDQAMPLPSNNDRDVDDLSLINVDESETVERSNNDTEQTMRLVAPRERQNPSIDLA